MTYTLIPETDDRLHQSAVPVSSEESIDELVASMFEICRASGGVALAAPQLGVMKQLIIIEHNNLVLVNPIVTPLCVYNMYDQNINTTFPIKEGCLSLPGVTRTIQRSILIKVVGDSYTPDAERAPIELYAYGVYSAIIQHEYDHLIGKLITDY